MRKKHMLSLLFAVLGVALLIATAMVGVASSATSKHPTKVSLSKAHKGGVLRVNQSGTDFDTVDPGLAYVTNDWAMLYTTQMLLVNFPEKNGEAGSVLFPEAATSFPTVSSNGKTYTFHIRPGLKFSDGSPVTAASYQRAWERNLSPKMGSPYGVNDQFQKVVVGGEDFLAGKTQHISGITAKGLTLTFHLTKPNPTFVSYLSMQWFGAVKPTMPYTTTGENVYPSAGPYYIASRDPGKTTILKRNPYYKGSRPANPDQIVFTSNTDPDQSLLQTKAGQTDLDMSGVPSTAAASLGTPSATSGQYHVGPTACVIYFLLNAARPPTSSLAVRKALNYGIDRPAVLRLLGKYAGARTDQILVPGIPGYHPYKIYAFAGANVAKAKQVGGSALANAGTMNVIHSTTPDLGRGRSAARVQPQAAGAQVQRRSDSGHRVLQHARDEGHVVQHRACWLVRRLLRPVRLHQRVARRSQHSGQQQHRHVVHQRSEAEQADGRCCRTVGQGPCSRVRQA